MSWRPSAVCVLVRITNHGVIYNLIQVLAKSSLNCRILVAQQIDFRGGRHAAGASFWGVQVMRCYPVH